MYECMYVCMYVSSQHRDVQAPASIPVGRFAFFLIADPWSSGIKGVNFGKSDALTSASSTCRG